MAGSGQVVQAAIGAASKTGSSSARLGGTGSGGAREVPKQMPRNEEVTRTRSKNIVDETPPTEQTGGALAENTNQTIAMRPPQQPPASPVREVTADANQSTPANNAEISPLPQAGKEHLKRSEAQREVGRRNTGMWNSLEGARERKEQKIEQPFPAQSAHRESGLPNLTHTMGGK